VKIGEAPSFGESILDYDSTSKGAENYLNLAHEVIEKNKLNGKSK
jgi:chromosome partitioning protein